MDKRRPLRDRFEDVTERIPNGPFGALGRGNVIGLTGFLAVESGEVITSPVPGLTRPGFKKVSHSVEVLDDGLQEHTVRIHAFSKDVAEFVTQYDSSASNYDFIRGKTEVKSVEEIDKQSSYTTYEITVEVDRRPDLR